MEERSFIYRAAGTELHDMVLNKPGEPHYYHFQISTVSNQGSWESAGRRYQSRGLYCSPNPAQVKYVDKMWTFTET